MDEFSRRSFLKGLGKAAAALGVGLSLGAGCAKEEHEMKPEEMAKGASVLPGSPRVGEAGVKEGTGAYRRGRKKNHSIVMWKRRW